jgi:hypothetical protein
MRQPAHTHTATALSSVDGSWTCVLGRWVKSGAVVCVENIPVNAKVLCVVGGGPLCT